MIVPNKQLQLYLLHRTGEKRINTSSKSYIKKALEGNVNSVSFLDTYGKKTIKAFVGFIDLAGFSTKVRGLNAQEIANFIFPFLTKLIEVLCDRNALVDKMVGDEIMFILPDYEEDGMPPSILLLGQIMGWLHDLAYELAPKYKYRITLSHGDIYIGHLKSDFYSEWTALGEAIHIAKRLQSIKELENPEPVCGAFGLSIRTEPIENVKKKMNLFLSYIAGFASRFDHSLKENPQELKGVGAVLCALLKSKGEHIETSVNSV